MSSKIAIDRDALLAAANQLSNWGKTVMAAPLWEVLAAPVVEHQPVAINPVFGYADSYRTMANLQSKEGREQAVRTWSVIADLERNIAPLFAELQATIARLTAENERLRREAEPGSWACWSCKEQVTMADRADSDGDCPHCEAELDLEDWPIREPAAELLHSQSAVADLKAENERLKGGQGEPVAWEMDDTAGESGEIFVTNCKAVRDEWVRNELPVCPLFASQPAPVSVVLPSSEDSEKAFWDCKHNGYETFMSGWNAYDNKVKELNQ